MNERELRLLVSQKAVKRVLVTQQEDIYFVQVNELTLESARKAARTWKSLDTLAGFLREMGLLDFNVRLIQGG
jgi:hypothetical protein